MDLIKTKGGDVWRFRFYETGSDGVRRRIPIIVGTKKQFPSESAARRHPDVQATLMRLNTGHAVRSSESPTLATVIAEYRKSEMDGVAYSTRLSYEANLRNYIEPKWNDYRLDEIRTKDVDRWLKELPLAPKSKAHLKALMHRLFNRAQFWEWTSKNPIHAIRISGSSKRVTKQSQVTPEQFLRLIERVRYPYSLMVEVAGFTGLRISEVLGLRWNDIDFEGLTLQVHQSSVHSRQGKPKTDSSTSAIPLPSEVAAKLIRHKESAIETEGNWVFANPKTQRPFYQESLQKAHIKPAMESLGLTGRIGWHTLRHSFRTWLDATGAPVGAQKDLMRHADIRTTLNIYGRTMTPEKREYSEKVVELIRRSS